MECHDFEFLSCKWVSLAKVESVMMKRRKSRLMSGAALSE